MTVELKKLSLEDGMDIYDMLQEIPKDENGFVNGCNGVAYNDYKQWLMRSDNIANGIGLEDWMVPQNIYWLYIDGKPVGMGKLRHRLTDKLKEDGGHIGYAIAPSYRNLGYGKTLVKLLIIEANKLGMGSLLLTIENHNIGSIQVAVANGGIIEKVNETRHYIWIDANAQ
ncbi:MAG: GNAT family N-acetyltransferase [Firmicutes bacterium]|nr:GNAT family N-acetyltransferase [Bacillota bacterium]